MCVYITIYTVRMRFANQRITHNQWYSIDRQHAQHQRQRSSVWRSFQTQSNAKTPQIHKNIGSLHLTYVELLSIFIVGELINDTPSPLKTESNTKTRGYSDKFVIYSVCISARSNRPSFARKIFRCSCEC